MKPYVLTEAKYNRIMGKREDEPTCCFQGCNLKLHDLIGQLINRNVSRGKMRYYCEKHNPELRRY